VPPFVFHKPLRLFSDNYQLEDPSNFLVSFFPPSNPKTQKKNN